MNKRIKNILLGVITSIGLISLLVKGSEKQTPYALISLLAIESKKQEPYAMRCGNSTVLIPGAASIFVHYAYNLDCYKKYYASEYKYFSALNNVPIFDSTGKFLMTLGNGRNVIKQVENKDGRVVLVASEDLFKKWEKIKRKIKRNNAVVCPNVVPQLQQKEKVPAIVVGTRDCGVCKQIEEYYKQ